MRTTKSFIGPVVIAGVGGSGTRVVAKIVSELGFFLGYDLNDFHDNLWYNSLFKRYKRSYRIKNHTSGIKKKFRVFEQAMTAGPEFLKGNHPFERYCYMRLIRTGIDQIRAGDRYPSRKDLGIWLINQVVRISRLSNFLRTKGKNTKYIGWGWKVPHTQVLIKHVADHFKNMKYIQVLRNGFDMAFSGNKNQLIKWGNLFDINIPKAPEEIPKATLQYWIKSNEYAISIGKRKLGKDFYVLNFENLCFFPKEEINKLVEFLDVQITKETFLKLSTIPKVPDTIGRHKKYDLSIFSEKDFEAVHKLTKESY
ncbi:MAG: sulfotransferase [Candidatus Hodarchaeota archaeon]